MKLYYELNELENLNSNLDKEEQLEYILDRFKNAEDFFKFAFSEDKFGVQEKTFKNIYGEKEGFNHISDWLEIVDPNMEFKHKVTDLIQFGYVLKKYSGGVLQSKIEDFFNKLPGIQKKWFCRAILKDLRCGIQVKTLNKVLKRLNREPIKKFALQLCDKIDLYNENDVKKKITFPVAAECKYDGIRIQAEISSDGDQTFVQLTSRRGKDRTLDYPEICEALCDKFAGENIILDGEIISSSFQELTRKDSKSQKKYVIFDLLVDEQLPYERRWDNLFSLLVEKGITAFNNNKNIKYNKNILVAAEHYTIENLKELQEYYEELNSRKEEGIIIKKLNSIYERGSRKHMFKAKKVHTADLEVYGFKFGEGKRSFMVATLCLKDKSGKIKVDVGSGIDDMTCEHLTDIATENREALTGKIVEILYNEITETGSIRFPRFIKIRDDKDEPDDLSGLKVRQNG